MSSRRAWEGLGASEGEVSDFGGAVEAEGKADGTEAAVDIELHVVEVEEAFDVLLAHGRKDERAGEGETNLAAVCVAREHDVNEGEAGVLYDMVGEVGFVAHKDAGLVDVDVGRDGEIEVGVAGAGVVGAGEPEEITAAFEGDVAVDEDGGSVGFEGRDDVVGTDVDVVIAEDAEALRGFELGEDLRADAGGVPGDGELAGAAADVVAGDEDDFGFEAVDLFDDAFEEEGLGVLLEVDVGDLDEAEADEGVGEIADGELADVEVELMAGVGAGVGGEANASGGCTGEEGAASDGGLLRMSVLVEAAGHSPS
jgi:hypothetical protein